MVRCLLALVLLIPLCAGAEWRQWRGAERNGISSETGLADSWPEDGPKKLWTAAGLGRGFSSFAASGGRLFTQGERAGLQYVTALDEATGRKLWETPNGRGYSDRRGGGPRGTPTVDGDRVYALSAGGNLICLEAASGKKIWESNLLDRFKASNIRWGISESPLIDGGKVIVNPGGRGASVVALDKNDGKLIWKSQSDKAGYSSAIAVEVEGVRQYILFTGASAVGLLAKNGELLWRYGGAANGTANIATPIFHDNHVFLSSAYGTGCALLKLTAGGAEEVYFNRGMRNHYSSSVLLDGVLYGYSGNALTAMDFKTGEVIWRDRSVGKGQVIFADGKLYLYGEAGVLGMARAAPDGYHELARHEIGRGGYPTWALPVISGGRLIVRDQETARAFDIRE